MVTGARWWPRPALGGGRLADAIRQDPLGAAIALARDRRVGARPAGRSSSSSRDLPPGWLVVVRDGTVARRPADPDASAVPRARSSDGSLRTELTTELARPGKRATDGGRGDGRRQRSDQAAARAALDGVRTAEDRAAAERRRAEEERADRRARPRGVGSRGCVAHGPGRAPRRGAAAAAANASALTAKEPPAPRRRGRRVAVDAAAVAAWDASGGRAPRPARPARRRPGRAGPRPHGRPRTAGRVPRRSPPLDEERHRGGRSRRSPHSSSASTPSAWSSMPRAVGARDGEEREAETRAALDRCPDRRRHGPPAPDRRRGRRRRGPRTPAGRRDAVPVRRGRRPRGAARARCDPRGTPRRARGPGRARPPGAGARGHRRRRRGRGRAATENATAAERPTRTPSRTSVPWPRPSPSAAAVWAAATPPDDPPSPGRLATLRRRYHELGAANPFAVTEYAEVRERLEAMEAQERDLRAAIVRHAAAHRGALDDGRRPVPDDVPRPRRAPSTRRFQQLFGGGFARLSLTEPDDLASTGVEIVARPPGKKAQALAMLSGGERALTAVALLFAMLEVRPVPFCVLDEVDAALDEANVGRFAEALRSLADSTQFIVITHNRGTIETADALYGVTVGEDSVSRVDQPPPRRGDGHRRSGGPRARPGRRLAQRRCSGDARPKDEATEPDSAEPVVATSDAGRAARAAPKRRLRRTPEPPPLAPIAWPGAPSRDASPPDRSGTRTRHTHRSVAGQPRRRARPQPRRVHVPPARPVRWRRGTRLGRRRGDPHRRRRRGDPRDRGRRAGQGAARSGRTGGRRPGRARRPPRPARPGLGAPPGRHGRARRSSSSSA